MTTSIKTPKSKQAFCEMVEGLAPLESINWQHYDDWFGNIDITLKIEYKLGMARAIITLRYTSGTEVTFDYRDVDSVVIHLWKYRSGMTKTGTLKHEPQCDEEALEQLAEEAVKMHVFGLLEQEDGYEQLSSNECRLPMTDGSKYKVRVFRDRLEVVFEHPYTGEDRIHKFTHRNGVEYIEHRLRHYYQREVSA
jgi:hypothetical protein